MQAATHRIVKEKDQVILSWKGFSKHFAIKENCVGRAFYNRMLQAGNNDFFSRYFEEKDFPASINHILPYHAATVTDIEVHARAAQFKTTHSGEEKSTSATIQIEGLIDIPLGDYKFEPANGEDVMFNNYVILTKDYS